MSTDAPQAPPVSGGRRWLALGALCLGVLMVVLDTTIVNVALPSIGEDLKFAGTSLVWAVNAYVLTFGGFLLLGGRLGDLYGHRRLFLVGILLFTIASFACGLANTQPGFIVARAAQGVNAAVIIAVTLSLLMSMFADKTERAKAIGIYSFICASGGTFGLLLGGALTNFLSWHWIFLVNVPIGLAVYLFCLRLLPRESQQVAYGQPDVLGAVLVTSFLILAVYAIVNGNDVGWASTRTVGCLAGALLLLTLFLTVELQVPKPLIPPRIFKLRNLVILSAVGALWSAGVSGWSFISVLYMQGVLGYGPMQVAMAFVPATVTTAVFALGPSTKLIKHFGVRTPLALGFLIGSIGLALFARIPSDGAALTHILPGMILFGLGGGIAGNALLVAAMTDVAESETGLASGIVSSTYIMGGALGIAIVVSVTAGHTNNLLASGLSASLSLIGGYRMAFLVSAACAATAAVFGAVFSRSKREAHRECRSQVIASEPETTRD